MISTSKRDGGFARQLRLLRERSGLSLRQLADRSGVRWNTIWRLEKGQHATPDWRTLCRLADALGVGIEQLRAD